MRIGIFGCGWLGRPLAKKLEERHTVFGAVRSDTSMKKLEKQGITAFQEPSSNSAFWDVDTLVISVSPRDNYLETLHNIGPNVKERVKQMILLSSISVYGDVDGRVDETTAVAMGIVAQGEALFKDLFQNGVIIRLGGLMGDDRVAGQWDSKLLKDAPVNYIHQEDAVEILEQVIERNIQNESINAVAPKHPKRSAVYQRNSARFGFKLPTFENGKEKVVVSEKSSSYG
ncbi:MAG: NAD(P)-binding domain-containing protein [Helicobacteraceae bacterium]|jgi:nucleoside-diphosphate-sugar epimerase|nr:NAD(P)-binding domain-containing protein [Helicobacteraceae bacterium]